LISQYLGPLNSKGLEANSALVKYKASICHLFKELQTRTIAIRAAEKDFQEMVLSSQPIFMELLIFSNSVKVFEAALKLHDQTNRLLSSFPEIPRVLGKRFPSDVTETLKASYRRNSYLSPEESMRLSRLTGLEESQVTMWFSNKRCREKKREYVPMSPSITISSEQQDVHDSIVWKDEFMTEHNPEIDMLVVATPANHRKPRTELYERYDGIFDFFSGQPLQSPF